MLKVALTGGIGSGKTTVAELLAARGAAIVDADVAARTVVEPGTPALAAIVERFGPSVLAPDGSLDRPALGARVFADADARRDLEAITHPVIRAEMARLVKAAPPDAVVVCAIPLLVETRGSDAGAGYDAVIVVEAPREDRVARLVARGLNRTAAEARIATQASDGARRAVATFVIRNDGDHAALARQVDECWADLESRLGPDAA